MKVRKQENTDFEPVATKKVLFPAGRHKIKLKGARLKPHSSGNGNMLSLWFEGIEGESKGLAIYHMVAAPSLELEKSKWWTQSMRILTDLAQAAGRVEGFDFITDEQLVEDINSLSDPLIGNIVHAYDEYVGGDRASFKFFSPFGRV